MFEHDNTLISRALSIWANYIETGNVKTSKEDAINTNQPINGMTNSQIRLVRKIRELASDALNNKINLTESS